VNPIHVKNIREYELQLIIPFLKNKGKLLEIGSGAGWQARILANIGFEVTAIELQDSICNRKMEYPVVCYDGFHMPFRENTFDVIFSSNVLEHISHIEHFQSEVQRVLKPSGISIHIMPSPTWRFWTNCTYYFHAIKKSVEFLLYTANSGPIQDIKKKREKYWTIRYIFPTSHGPNGTSIKEIYLFSRRRWLSLFDKTGWIINNYFSSHLFYSGYCIFNDKLSLKIRHFLSYILGSSTIVYILKKL
jgi:cyclopropane fatty-acyl-phospholipid synthase-like methyltransferase